MAQAPAIGSDFNNALGEFADLVKKLWTNHVNADRIGQDGVVIEGKHGGAPRRTLPTLMRATWSLAWEADRSTVLASTGVQVVGGLGAGAQLLLARQVLERTLDSSNDDVLRAATPWLIALVGLTVLLSLVTVVQNTLSQVLGQGVSVRATEAILEVAVAVEPEDFERSDFHDKLERARKIATERPLLAVRGFAGLLGAAVGTAGVGAVAVSIDPLLIPIAAISGVPIMFANRLNSRRQLAFARSWTLPDRQRMYLGSLLTDRDLVKEVRVYDMAPEILRRHRNIHHDRLAATRHLARIKRRTSAVAAILAGAGLILALTYLYWSIGRDRIALADAGTALFALLFIGQRLRMAEGASGALYEAAIFIDDVEEFRTMASDLGHNAGPAEPFSDLAKLTASGITYTYPGGNEPVLKGVDVELERGQIVALVGLNGSGKSTLAKVLAGIYPPESGSIMWDGIEVASDRGMTSRVRASVAIVFQDFAKFALSAADNVGLGDSRRMSDKRALAEAADAAGASFVRDLPNGWDQTLSTLFPDGTDLSGGQWQRLATARALFRTASLLIMDEPSSALDPLAELELLTKIRTVADESTVLFISHRFSNVRQADKILVMHQGQVIEQGDHDHLMKLDGTYAELFRVQASLFGLS